MILNIFSYLTRRSCTQENFLKFNISVVDRIAGLCPFLTIIRVSSSPVFIPSFPQKDHPYSIPEYYIGSEANTFYFS